MLLPWDLIIYLDRLAYCDCSISWLCIFANLRLVNKSSKVLGLLDLEMSSEVCPLEVSGEIGKAMR